MVVTVAQDALVVRFAKATDNIQNGSPDAVGLLDVSAGRLVDALSYEGAVSAGIVAGIGTPLNFVEGTVLPTTIADSNTQNGSLVRQPNGVDTDDAASDWRFATTPTPGAPNLP